MVRRSKRKPAPAAQPRALGEKERAAVAQIRAGALALLADGRTEEAVDYFAAALNAVLLKNTELELLMAKLRKPQAKTSSERVSPEQLFLLLEQLLELTPEPEKQVLVEARADAQVDQEIEQAEQKERAERGQPRARGGKWTTRNVERQVHRVEVAESERICRSCGGAKRPMGEDITHILEYVPAHFVEHEFQLQKYACGTCKRGVSTAEGPAKVIERSAAGASVLAHVVVSKYVDHTPLQRLHRIYARSGADIAVSTLADWVAAVADRLLPLVDLLSTRVLAAHVIQADATGLMVLDPNSPENVDRGTVWCYVGDDRDVIFRYTPTGEGASGPWQFLAKRTGYIQADAASVFDRLFTGQAASALEVGCWAHARRRFVELGETDCRAAYPLQLITRLYRIEYLADLRRLQPDQRMLLRRERSEPVLNNLKRWLLTTLQKEPPSSDLARAMAYCINQWTALTRFVLDGRLSLDNNQCERQLRDIALGRKNFLFAGSHDAARRAAVLYSLMRSCAQHGVALLPYLTDVLRKMAHGWEENRLVELLPDRWQHLHAPDQPAAESPLVTATPPALVTV